MTAKQLLYPDPYLVLDNAEVSARYNVSTEFHKSEVECLAPLSRRLAAFKGRKCPVRKLFFLDTFQPNYKHSSLAVGLLSPQNVGPLSDPS